MSPRSLSLKLSTDHSSFSHLPSLSRSLVPPASLSHLPPHAFQSSSEHLAFTSQIDDLTHRLQNDPTNGTLAEKTARQLRKEIKNLPSEIEKEGSGASGSVAELWWKLMWTGDAKIMSESCRTCFRVIEESGS